MRECHWRKVILLGMIAACLVVTFVAIYREKIGPTQPIGGLRKHDSILNTTSKLNSSLQPLALEFVVSHYNEDLDWLRPLANYSHVYHKGKDKAPPFPINKWEKLPNVGREGHTFLHHIIQHYDRLADLTVFLQGHGPALSPKWCFPTPMDFVSKAADGRYCKVIGELKDWGMINLVGKYGKALKSGRMRVGRVRTTGAFYATVFGSPPPVSAPLCYTACFSATRGNLQRHPLSLYQRAISFLDDHPNPEEGHFMERLWATVINV